MAVLKYLAPALAVAGHAAAASCSTSATLTVGSASDATALAGCQTFTGSIAVATGTTDSIALDGIQEITGDLVSSGNTATEYSSLSSSSLSSIGGTFNLTNLIHLTTLNFPMLTQAGSVYFNVLPVLSGLMFQSGLNSIQSLTIQDTALTSLSGINPQQAATVDIVSNSVLTSINMALKTVSNSLSVTSNLNTLTASFPDLEWASTMTLSDVASVSFPALSAINTSAYFYDNSFQTLAAPNLTSIGAILSITDNSDLTNISMPALTTIVNEGALDIQANTALMNITGFPKLMHVAGTIDVSGSFKAISFPALNYVRGGLNVTSTEDISDSCSVLKALENNGTAIDGGYNCVGNAGADVANSTSSPDGSAGPTGSPSGSKSSTTSSSAAHPILIPGATGLLGVVAAVFGML